MESAELLITLLHSATIAHVLHLQSRSYSEHKALEKLYVDLPDKVDAVIEAWQGRHQELIEYPTQTIAVQTDETALEFVEYLKELLANERDSLGEESEIQNLVDDIAQLIDSTIYKLTFLH